MQRGPGRRLGGAKVSMRSVFVHVWVDAPLTTRVTLNMKDFGGREVGLSAKSFEVQHVSSTHRLSAKGSRDASLHVESTRAWRFCGCVRGRATPGPSNARDNAFGWASGPWRAPESCARCLAGAAVASTFCVQRNPTMPLSVLEARMWSVSVVVGVGVPLRARTVLEMVHLDGRAGWRARELRALSEVLLRASFVCKGIP